MFTAKIQRTEEPQAGLDIYVDFYNDGVYSHTENVIPQDKAGFIFWKESRLKSLNTKLALKSELTNGREITDLSENPVLTQVERDKILWQERDFLKEQVDKAITKGYLTGKEPKVVQLNNWLKTNFKPEYLGLL